MKVKELRSWLSEFGEKQNQHRVRSEGTSLASTDKLSFLACSTLERKDSNAETSPTSSRAHTSPRTQMEELEAAFSPRSCKIEYTEGRTVTSSPLINGNSKVLCAKCGSSGTGSRANLTVSDCFVETSLSLKQKPSTDPTVTTQDDSTAASNGIPQKTASWDTTMVSGGSWDNIDFPDPDPTFDFSPSSSFDESIESNPRRTGSSNPTEPTRERPEDHYCAMEKPKGCGLEGLDNMGELHISLLQMQPPILAKAERPEELHERIDESASIPSSMHSANIFGNKTLTAGTLDFICSDGKLTRSPRSLLPGYFVDDETGSSFSNDSSSNPSFIPGALDSKMAQLLLDPYPINEAIRQGAGYKRASYSIPRCKKIDPKDLEFLHRKRSPSAAESEINGQGRRSSVSRGIKKFGGTKKTIVERRKEELEKLWAENKAAVHVKKIKWGVCQRTGMYKKKIVIDLQQK